MPNARVTRDSRQQKVAAMRARAAREQARRRSLIVGSFVVVVLVILVGVFVVVRTAKHDSAVSATKTPSGFDANDSVMVGSAGAPVTVVAYEDFQCPICRQFEQENRAQLQAYVKAGTVKIQYRPIAFLDRESTTNYSTRALNAAAAVVDTDPSAFPAFHQLLFDNQPAEQSAGLTNQKLIDLAVQAGASRATITAAVEHETYKGWTQKVTEDSSKAGVSGTPTVKVNGQQLAQPDLASLKVAIDKAAAKK